MFAGSRPRRGAALADVRLAAGRRLAGSDWSPASVPVTSTRGVTKADMPLNDALPGHPRRPGHLQGLDRRRRGRARPGDRRCPSPSATRCSDGPADAAARRLALPVRVLRALARPRAGGRRRPARRPGVHRARASAGSPRPTHASRSRRARRGVRDGGPRVAGRAARALDEEWAARCPSPALRAAARRLGAQLLRTAAVAFGAPLRRAASGAAAGGASAPSSAGTPPRRAAPPRPSPRTATLRGSRRGRSRSAWSPRWPTCPTSDTALLALYDDAATVASAALKLLAARSGA